jgi:hypothetical protein
MTEDPNPPVDDEENDAALPEPDVTQNDAAEDPKNDSIPEEETEEG